MPAAIIMDFAHSMHRRKIGPTELEDMEGGSGMRGLLLVCVSRKICRWLRGAVVCVKSVVCARPGIRPYRQRGIQHRGCMIEHTN